MKKNKTDISYMPIVRKPNYEWNGIEKHWLFNNYFATHFINSMHVVFPDGEKFFIRSVKNFFDQIEDPALKERVKAFIGQEAQHMAQHKSFWEVLRKESDAVDQFLPFYNRWGYEYFEEFSNRFTGGKLGLSVTVALEHYTAIFAESALEYDSRLLQNFPPEMKAMLQWHAAEEIEHKAVAFDVLKEVDDDYLLRIAGMILGTFSLSFFILTGQLVFLINDKNIDISSIPNQLFNFLQRATPLFTNIANHVLDYLRPDFHPDDNQNRYLAEEIFQKFDERKIAV
jgi:predicted metal-dependent hydrolase